LNHIVAHHGDTDRAKAKLLPNIVASGGHYKTWLRTCEIVGEQHPDIRDFVDKLRRELRTLQDYLVAHEDFAWLEIERTSLQEKSAPSSWLPHIIRSCENRVLRIIHECFFQNGWCVLAKIFDGLIVQPPPGKQAAGEQSLKIVMKKAEGCCEEQGWLVSLIEKDLHGLQNKPIQILRDARDAVRKMNPSSSSMPRDQDQETKAKTKRLRSRDQDQERSRTRPRGQETKRPRLPKMFWGKIIYATSGSGKTTVANKYEDVWDVDDFFVEAMQKVSPSFQCSETGEVDNRRVIAKYHRYIKFRPREMQKVNKLVLTKMKAKCQNNDVVLLGTRDLMHEADLIIIQRDSSIVREQFDQNKEASIAEDILHCQIEDIHEYLDNSLQEICRRSK
jgi:hypothetical protein